jgi:hypothetical protein
MSGDEQNETPGSPPMRRVVRRDPANSRSVGEAYLGSLIRAQLGLAIQFFLGLIVMLGLIISVLVFVPPIRHRTVTGVPIAWFILGVATYPSFAAMAWIYNRAADRNESQFVDLSLNKSTR